VEGEQRAIKVMINEENEARKEANLIATVEHPNVIKVHATSTSDSTSDSTSESTSEDVKRGAIIMDLWQMSLTDCFEDLNASQRASVAIQLASGLAAIHKEQILHRDISCCNALVNICDDGTIHACWTGFGSAMKGFDNESRVWERGVQGTRVG
jgi:serine/threonine protein kinase